MNTLPALNCILLVDDDPAAHFISKAAIRNAGINVRLETALNGQEALNYIQEAGTPEKPQPELILLDINMPLMDGWGFLEAYQALPETQREHTIVAMLTTSLNPDDARLAESHPCLAGFANKPLTADKMAEMVRRYFPEPATPVA